MQQITTYEPEDWKKYPIGIPIAGFFGYWASLYLGNDGNLATSAHVAAVVGTTTLLVFCVLSDSAEYRTALSNMLKKRIVDLTFTIVTYMGVLGIYCFSKAYLLGGNMGDDLGMLLLSSLVAHLAVFKFFAPGIRFVASCPMISNSRLSL